MNKINNTTMAILLLASVMMLVGGLVVIPALEEPAEASEGFKKNGDLCKPKKVKA
jgi:hypothetical protein